MVLLRDRQAHLGERARRDDPRPDLRAAAREALGVGGGRADRRHGRRERWRCRCSSRMTAGVLKQRAERVFLRLSADSGAVRQRRAERASSATQTRRCTAESHRMAHRTRGDLAAAVEGKGDAVRAVPAVQPDVPANVRADRGRDVPGVAGGAGEVGWPAHRPAAGGGRRSSAWLAHGPRPRAIGRLIADGASQRTVRRELARRGAALPRRTDRVRTCSRLVPELQRSLARRWNAWASMPGGGVYDVRRRRETRLPGEAGWSLPRKRGKSRFR